MAEAKFAGKKRKIYYLPKYGQLGNQLAVLAHLLAFAIEYDFIIVYPKTGFLSTSLKANKADEKRIKFSKLLANSVFSYCLITCIKVFCLNRNRYLFNGLFINTNFTVEEDLKTPKNLKFVVVTDWMFRYYEGVKEFQDNIRQQLSFDESTFVNAERLFTSVKEKYLSHTFIGVHVRRGDYATWLDGRFFYDDSIYYTRLKEMAQQIEKPLFIICSNEDLCFKNDLELNIIYAKGSPAEDIFLLSKCTYILGPPSTFSSWAAFLGNQFLLLLESKNEEALLRKFSKYYL